MKKILVVEDEENIRTLEKLYLQKEGYEPILAATGREALRLFDEQKPDLVILDLMLPELNGEEVCREIRKKSTVPIIMVTAKSDEIQKLEGLEIGADDYVTKPFSPRELIARVKAHLRREEMDAEPGAVEIGPFRLDRTAHRVFLEGRELSLTSTEFNLLEFFLTHRGRAYSRSQLLEAVWGEQRYVTPRTVDVHVRRLREQIEEQPDSPRFLTTVRGFGYRFEEPS